MNELKNILNSGIKFYKELKEDKNGRYRSWEYCYKIFNEAHKANNVDDKFIDYLCLNLAFYLASWGMYRGSSFLLQRDYKVHKPIIEELLKEKYNCLWGINISDYIKKETQKALIELVEEMKKMYNIIRLSVKEEAPKNEISDTLITKVLMGTMGCVPAYDRYFIEGIKKYKVASGKFNIRSILQLVHYYNDNYDMFEETRSQMNISGMEYPQMKVIDMCFWQVGFDLDKNKCT